jgi:hypothetical protein
MGRIITRDDGRKFHIGGRHQPKTPHKMRLHDPKYGLNLSQWPDAPSSTSFGTLPAAQPVLTDILGNDTYGDCTEANSYHLQALRQAASRRTVFHPTLAQVLATYSRDGGFVMGDASTDNGCDEVTVMQNAMNLGITNGDGIDKIAAFIAIDATNRELVRKCISMFVGATVCMAITDAWLAPFPSSPNWTWDVPSGGYVPDPNNGHCFTLADQNDKALQGWSWAMPFTLTYDALAAGAVAATGGAIYIEADQEILDQASQAAPDGLDWACLQADLASYNAP